MTTEACIAAALGVWVALFVVVCVEAYLRGRYGR